MAHAKSPSASDAVLLTRQDARRLLGIGQSTLDSLLRSGDLPVVRLGKRCIRIRRNDIENFVAREARPWKEAR